MFEDSLFSFITNNTAIKAIINNRLYPLVLPFPVTFPAIAYTKISGKRNSLIGYAMPVYQFSCFAETNDEAKELANTLIAELDQHKGSFGAISIKNAVYQNAVDLYDPEVQVFYIPVEIKFIFKEDQ